MKLSNFIDGIEILRKYYDGNDGYHIGAEHDQFFMYATSTKIPETDIARLKELGWNQETEEYDENEAWYAYT